MPGGIDMSPRVLVVEDDAAIAELLRYNLEAEGYLSTVVASGEEAELQVAEDHFDLAIVDWMLPGLSGIDAASFEAAAKDAEGKCPVSNALRGNLAIEVAVTIK